MSASQKAKESLPRKLLKPDADGMVRISAADLWRLPPGKTDWAKVDALTDEDIARDVADDPDAAFGVALASRTIRSRA